MSQGGPNSVSGSGNPPIETLTGNSGGPVGPDGAFNIDLVGTSPIQVAGNAGLNTLTIFLDSEVAQQFDTDSGSAVPSVGVLNIVGDHGINTTGSGNTVTALIDNEITLGDLSAIGAGSNALTCTSGDVQIVDGSLKIPDTSDSTTGVIFSGGFPYVHSFGMNNFFAGDNVGNFTLTSTDCTGIGVGSLNSLTTALNNTACGSLSLRNVTSGNSNTAVGTFTGDAITTGAGNAFLGTFAGGALDSDQNTGIGAFSLETTTTGTDNTGCGYFTLRNYNGSDTVAIGSGALASSTSGNDNTAVGRAAAGFLTTGTDNIAIGSSAGGAFTTTESNNIAIGNIGVISDSATIRIGTTGTHTSAFVAGIASVAVSNKEHVTIDTSTGELGSELGVTSGGSSTDNALSRWDGTGGDTLQDSTVIVTDNGEMTNASQPSFLAYSASTQSNVTGDGTAYTIVFGTEVFDQNSDFDGTSTFTAPVTGNYQFNVVCGLEDIGAGHTTGVLRLVASGNNYAFWVGSPAACQAADNTLHINGSIIVPMTALDTAICQILVFNSTLTVDVRSGRGVSFSGALIC